MSGGLDKLERIRLVAFDVDGVFTDGRFYLADDGTETKAFHTQDGYGVRRLLEAGDQLQDAVATMRYAKKGWSLRFLCMLAVSGTHVGISLVRLVLWIWERARTWWLSRRQARRQLPIR